MSSQPAPSLAQAGSGHWRCPLQEEEEEEEDYGMRENGKGVGIRMLILSWVVSAHHLYLTIYLTKLQWWAGI